MTDLPARAVMMDGTPVADLRPCHGLIRGIILAGQDQRGEPVTKALHWYPDGRMTPARPSMLDLDLTGERAARATRTTAGALAARFRCEAIEAEAEDALDDWLGDL